MQFSAKTLQPSTFHPLSLFSQRLYWSHVSHGASQDGNKHTPTLAKQICPWLGHCRIWKQSPCFVSLLLAPAISCKKGNMAAVEVNSKNFGSTYTSETVRNKDVTLEYKDMPKTEVTIFWIVMGVPHWCKGFGALSMTSHYHKVIKATYTFRTIKLVKARMSGSIELCWKCAIKFGL